MKELYHLEERNPFNNVGCTNDNNLPLSLFVEFLEVLAVCALVYVFVRRCVCFIVVSF